MLGCHFGSHSAHTTLCWEFSELSWMGSEPLRVSMQLVYCLSQAAKSIYESSYVTQDFARLLDGIKELLPISLNCKLDRHYRWLAAVLRRSAFHLRVHIANETRGEEERKELTEYLHNQLDKLEKEADKVAKELQKDVKER